MTRRTETRAVSPPRESVQRETQRIDTALSLTLSADGLEKKREELDYEFHSSRLFFFSFFFSSCFSLVGSCDGSRSYGYTVAIEQ